MQVKLISTTKPSIEEVSNLEDLIVYTARVSSPNNQTNFETSEKLLRYMLKNEHWSPFEMVDMTVEIITSRAISHQIIRHKSFGFSEISQRYTKVFQHEPIELRSQAINNRQSSVDSFETDITVENAIENVMEDCFRLYENLINIGVARETARFVLPECTQTKIYMKGSVRSWIHYLKLRTSEHTQKEHRLIALEIEKIFKKEFPIISSIISNQQS